MRTTSKPASTSIFGSCPPRAAAQAMKKNRLGIPRRARMRFPPAAGAGLCQPVASRAAFNGPESRCSGRPLRRQTRRAQHAPAGFPPPVYDWAAPPVLPEFRISSGSGAIAATIPRSAGPRSELEGSCLRQVVQWAVSGAGGAVSTVTSDLLGRAHGKKPLQRVLGAALSRTNCGRWGPDMKAARGKMFGPCNRRAR